MVAGGYPVGRGYRIPRQTTKYHAGTTRGTHATAWYRWYRCASCASAAWRYLPPASAAWAARIGSLPSRTSPRAPSVAATAQSTHCRKAGFGRGRAHMNSCRAPCCWSTRCSILCERTIALKSAMRAQADGDCWKGMNQPVRSLPTGTLITGTDRGSYLRYSDHSQAGPVKGGCSPQTWSNTAVSRRKLSAAWISDSLPNERMRSMHPDPQRR